MKRTLFVLFVLLFAFALRAEECAAAAATMAPETATAAAPAMAAAKDGYALLNSLLTLFDNLTLEKKESPGEQKVQRSGLALVDSRISQLGIDVKASLEAGLIDKIFYHRYRRMLTIFKLVTMPVIRGEILKDMFMREFDEFVWATTCERWAWEDKDAIPKMAAAMEEEFVQMMTYLDTRQKRLELKAKIGRRILPPPPPPPPAKKKAEEKKPE